ncbi:MAG: 50S ribosomal protein L1 [Alphaproteobacteria bacterium]|nr:50S ribosomal protein L1 [Alphaproteobacteria bacterium]
MKKQKDIVKHSAANLEEAIKKIQELATANKRKFNESVDVAVNLGIDAKQSDQSVKGSVLLPHGSGKKVRVIVFAANEDQQKTALEAGAIFAGFEDLVAKIEGGFLDFDCCVATPDVMPKISKVAKKLGPRGLMPSPKNGTVTNDIKKAVTEAMKGKVDFKNDKAGTVHCMIGKVDFDAKNLLENLQMVVKAIKAAKPEAAKGKFLKEFFLSSTMGPSVQVAVESI